MKHLEIVSENEIIFGDNVYVSITGGCDDCELTEVCISLPCSKSERSDCKNVAFIKDTSLEVKTLQSSVELAQLQRDIAKVDMDKYDKLLDFVIKLSQESYDDVSDYSGYWVDDAKKLIKDIT